MSESKSILILNRRSPIGSNFAKESLDVALMSAVFNQKTSLLFMDDGILQLVKGQDPAELKIKNNSATLPMLEMYEVNSIYADKDSLEQRGLTEQDLLIPVTLLDSESITELCDQQQLILNF